MEIVTDIEGVEFELTERRATDFGFDILFGRLLNLKQFPRLLATPALLAHIADRDGRAPALPLARSTVRRLYRLDRHSGLLTRWFARKEALLFELGPEAFARRFKVTVASATRHAAAMTRPIELYAVATFGRRLSPWRARASDADQDALDLGHATYDDGHVWYTVPAKRISIMHDPRRGPAPA